MKLITIIITPLKKYNYIFLNYILNYISNYIFNYNFNYFLKTIYIYIENRLQLFRNLIGIVLTNLILNILITIARNPFEDKLQ